MTLLPLNSTKLQRDLERSNLLKFDENKVLEVLRNFKSNPSDDLLLWLIWEYGLEDILPYISELPLLISEGIKWQRIKGTPMSINIALGWIGRSKCIIEEEPVGLYFYQYQLKVDKIPSKYDLINIHHLCKMSAPVRSRLARLYNEDFDRRKLILSESKLGDLLSDYSGYQYNINDEISEPLILSFGNRNEILVEKNFSEIKTVHLRNNHCVCNRVDEGGVGESGYADTATINHISLINRSRTIGVSGKNNKALIQNGYDWLGQWNRRTWSDSDFINAHYDRERIHGRRCRLNIEIEGNNNLRAHKSYVDISYDSRKISDYKLDRNYSTLIGDINNESLLNTGYKWFGAWRKDIWTDSGFFNTGIDRIRTISGSLNYENFESETVNKSESILHVECEGKSVETANHQYLAYQVDGEKDKPLTSTGLNWFGNWRRAKWTDSGFVNTGSDRIRAISGALNYENFKSESVIKSESSLNVNYEDKSAEITSHRYLVSRIKGEKEKPLTSVGFDWFGNWRSETWMNSAFAHQVYSQERIHSIVLECKPPEITVINSKTESN